MAVVNWSAEYSEARRWMGLGSTDQDLLRKNIARMMAKAIMEGEDRWADIFMNLLFEQEARETYRATGIWVGLHGQHSDRLVDMGRRGREAE